LPHRLRRWQQLVWHPLRLLQLLLLLLLQLLPRVGMPKVAVLSSAACH